MAQKPKQSHSASVTSNRSTSSHNHHATDHTFKVSTDVLTMLVQNYLDPASAICLALTNKRMHDTVLFAEGKQSLRDVLPKPDWPFCYVDFEKERTIEEIDKRALGIQRHAGYYAFLIRNLGPRFQATHKICWKDAKWVVKGRKHQGCWHCTKGYKASVKKQRREEEKERDKMQQVDPLNSRRPPGKAP